MAVMRLVGMQHHHLAGGAHAFGAAIAKFLRNDLAAWQKANVAAFLSGGLVHRFPEMIGEPYRDADQHLYTPLVREPIFIYGADAAEIKRTYERARNRELDFGIYTAPLFKT